MNGTAARGHIKRKHRRPWPPKKQKARDGNQGPSGELPSDTKLNDTGENIVAVVNPASLVMTPDFVPVDDAHLWAQVSPEATWRHCPDHGIVTRPLLREWRFADGSHHIKLNCPFCLCSLGLAKRTKTFEVATVAKREATYRQYIEEAAARGWKPGSAYFRYKSRFGCEPDPAWRATKGAGAP